MQEDWLDIVRNYLFIIYILLLIPLNIVNATDKHITEISIRAYRLRHYEYSSGGDTIIHGSKTSRVTWDAVTLGSDFIRKTVIIDWKQLVTQNIENLQTNLGAILIIIPKDLVTLSLNDKKAFLEIESKLTNFNTEQAVYIIQDSEEIRIVLNHVKSTGGRASTATQQMINSITSNNYVMTSSFSVNPPIVKTNQYNVIAKLISDNKGPTLIFTAHYDSASIAPAISVQADSNGSGVAALLELYAVLRKFYSKGNKPKYNILFAFTTGGKYNYQGARSFIDSSNRKDDIELAVCLDSLGSGEELYMHVAKMPKEDSIVSKLFNRIVNSMSKSRKVKILHKKINIAAETLAWEHQMFLTKKRQAVTFSHFNDSKDPMRESLLDTKDNVNVDVLYFNTKAIVNGILSFIYDLDESVCADAIAEGDVCSFVGDNVVVKERLANFLEAVISIPRHIENSEVYAKFLKNTLERYSANVELEPVKFINFNIYSHIEDKIHAHVTKPAVFELFVGLSVAAYLFLFYVFTLNLESVLTSMVSIFNNKSG